MGYYRAVAPPAAPTTERIGVLMINRGAPDSASYFAVQRYLRESLGDRRVVDLNPLVWLPLLYALILPIRPLLAARKHRRIWLSEGSPSAVYSGRLAAKVGRLLQARFGDEVRVELAMAHGNPSIAAAIESLAGQNVKRLLVLPLYPQYSSATTGAAFDRAGVVLERWRWLPEIRFVNDYHADAGYIDALSSHILRHWSEAGERSHLVLSYHGIPRGFAAGGDPHQAQCETTTRLVASRLGLAPDDYSHCYLRRFGATGWRGPDTQATLEALKRSGVRRVSVVTPSFAADCLETLEEIGRECRDEFLRTGGERLTLIPALNDDDGHAEALAAIVMRQLRGWKPNQPAPAAVTRS